MLDPILHTETSFVSPKATIGNNATISPFCYIDEDVVIGNNCYLYPRVTILKGTRIGDNCTIFPGAVVGAIPQDLKYKGEDSLLEIGDHVTIRECCTLNRGTVYSGTTKIGDHCMLMAYCHVAHDCIIGNHVIMSNAVNLAGHVEIGEHTILGGLVAVHQFSKIGSYVMIGGAAKVRKDIPPYIKADRDPISFVGVNSIGLKRHGFDSKRIDTIKEIYHHLFIRHKNLDTATSTIKEQFSSSEDLNSVLHFISSSDRGILRGYNV